MNNHNCPICNLQIQDDTVEFCPKCNWELIIICENASTGLKNYYTRKLEKHKIAYAEILRLNQEFISKDHQVGIFEKLNAELETKNKLLNSEMEKQKPLFEKAKKIEQECSQKESTIEKLKGDLEKEKKAHIATKIKAKTQKF